MIKSKLNISINIDSMFDVHVKRIHEYKRQLLNVLHVITLYNRILTDPASVKVSRSVIFGGKAAPGYKMAKLLIRLIHDVGDVINNDPQIGEQLKVVFIPNYNVSNAEIIIPACELSQQISTAGMEASGTGNMKFALNGALTIGTMDGANIEIREQVGEENIFIFGLSAEQIKNARANTYDPWEYYNNNDELQTVIDMLEQGFFSPDQADRYHPIVHALTEAGDHYMLLADYESYLCSQQQVEQCYLDQDTWNQKAILNVANMGNFSSDRTVMEYAQKIWNVKPVINNEG